MNIKEIYQNEQHFIDDAFAQVYEFLENDESYTLSDEEMSEMVLELFTMWVKEKNAEQANFYKQRNTITKEKALEILGTAITFHIEGVRNADMTEAEKQEEIINMTNAEEYIKDNLK